ncbi:Guanine Nucleotide-Binding Protein-Like 1 [Manis pentadactyla]|nr:Guanine Nucleotide-Binding Protein-Like 1 [Manis pentadactyla]
MTSLLRIPWETKIGCADELFDQDPKFATTVPQDLTLDVEVSPLRSPELHLCALGQRSPRMDSEPLRCHEKALRPCDGANSKGNLLQRQEGCERIQLSLIDKRSSHHGNARERGGAMPGGPCGQRAAVPEAGASFRSESDLCE